MNNRYETVVKVAIYYYEDGLTQSEIAKILGISRPTVSNLLKEALEKGIVKITIQDNFLSNHKQQEFITDKYKLQTVLITNTEGNDENVKAAIGRLCASYVESRLDEIKTLGIGWGSTVKYFVEAANYLNYPQLSIIPLMGGVSLSEISLHSNHLVFTLGQKYNAKTNLLYAPAIAENIEVREIVANSEIVQAMLTKGKNVDLAIIGVGNPVKSLTYRNMGYMSDEEESEIIKKNAIGDILATLFDKSGKPVDTSLSRRMIGPTLKDIKNMKEVLVLASGHDKAISIKALLELDIIQHLIIDKEIADLL